MTMIEWITNNKEWMFSGIGIFVLSLVPFFRKGKQHLMKEDGKILSNNDTLNSLNSNNGTTIVASNNSKIIYSTLESKKQSENTESTPNKTPQLPLDSQKALTDILFIDNEDFKIVNIIKQSGWRNCSQIKKIGDLNLDKIKKAHIIFVDIKGVGEKLFGDEAGLGVAKALKEKYPQKAIVLYSAESNWNIFHDAISIVDERIEKNAKPIEFISLIETFADRIWKEGL